MQKYLSLSGGSRHARLKLLGYYAQRVCTSRRLRRATTRAVIAGLGALHGQDGRARTLSPAVEIMRAQGHVQLGRLLSAAQCAEMLAWLHQRPMIAARGSGLAFTFDEAPADARIGDFPLDTVVNCPHVLDLANHPDMLALAGGYLGYTPIITLMGLRWSFPGAGADADVQHFHRDVEPGSIKLFAYLTDVDAASGPHHYVARSHLDRMPLRMQRYADREVALRYGGSVAITGPAGTAFAIDVKGIHKGAPPVTHARLMLVIQYSLLPCLMYDYAPVLYRGRARFSTYTNRLMVAPDDGRSGRPSGSGDTVAPLQD
jgi:hypothetical protein